MARPQGISDFIFLPRQERVSREKEGHQASHGQAAPRGGFCSLKQCGSFGRMARPKNHLQEKRLHRRDPFSLAFSEMDDAVSAAHGWNARMISLPTDSMLWQAQ